MTLKELVEWVAHVPESLPKEMRPMAESICESFKTVAKRLMDLGLSYLSLDRAAATLSTGERQRMQLARAVRNRTTGVLYVLDEHLHPSPSIPAGNSGFPVCFHSRSPMPLLHTGNHCTLDTAHPHPAETAHRG